MVLPYTLTILCPSMGSPGFLRYLQQSDVNPLWIGQYPQFYRKYDPSKWPWSHAMLTEGHGVKLPNSCKTMQTWSFEVDADKSFAPDNDSMTDDGSRDFDNKPAGHYDQCKRTRRFCALNFLVARAAEDEQKYEQHLSDLAEQHKDLDMRIQLTGHISNIKENLGQHSKNFKPTKPKPNKKKHRVLTLAEIEALDNPTVAAPSTPAPLAETPPPPPTFFVLLSFPTEEEHKQFMERDGNAKANDSTEEIILAKHLYLPPKSKPISSGDWSYGNPHEPYGQDWFG